MVNSIETIETTLQVNKFARRNRHMKVFSKTYVWRNSWSTMLKLMSIPLQKAGELSFFNKTWKLFAGVKTVFLELLPHSPQKKLFFQSILLSTSAIILTSLTPGGTFTAASMSYSTDYIAAYALPGDVLVADEDGYLVKINPQTDESSRVGLTDFAVHTVESGETLSVIAERYGVNVDTIKWENGIANANTLRVGQKLMVPPVDGVSYEVASNDDLSKIADKYDIPVDAIIAQNSLASESVTKGQRLFLPGAEPIAPPVTVATGDYRAVSVSRGNSTAAVSAAPSSDAPAVGKIFIFPTRGKITQGYNGGHYALDIGDRSKPPVWASGGGTVTKVSTGTWGGGYGNHIIVDHGNGLQTLYAHLDSVNVYSGQWVNQGDVIGIMGNTGRVYGVTGIHLHWEVHQDGVKKNPSGYY